MARESLFSEFHQGMTETTPYSDEWVSHESPYNQVILGRLGGSGRSMDSLGAEMRVVVGKFRSVVAGVESETVDVYDCGVLRWVEPEQAVSAGELRIDPIPFLDSDGVSFVTSIDVFSRDVGKRVMGVLGEVELGSVVVVVPKDASITGSMVGGGHVKWFVTGDSIAGSQLHPIGEYGQVHPDV